MLCARHYVRQLLLSLSLCLVIGQQTIKIWLDNFHKGGQEGAALGNIKKGTFKCLEVPPVSIPYVNTFPQEVTTRLPWWYSG